MATQLPCTHKVISAEIRQNGIHLHWLDTAKEQRDETRSHHIVLQLGKADLMGPSGPCIPPAVDVRLKAFAHTCAVGDGSPKKQQKRLEKDIAERGYSLFGSVLEVYNIAIREMQAEYAKAHQSEVDMARSSLKWAVQRAHDHFSPEEVETICREALVEHVLKS